MRGYEPPAGLTMAAYRFALDPTVEQVAALRSHCGAARKAFNWGLALVKAVMEQRQAEATYGMSGGGLTPTLPWTLPALRKRWNVAKYEVAPWSARNSKESYNTGLANLVAALRNWSDSYNGRRAGRRVGFPRFRGRRAGIGSVRFTTGSFGLAKTDRRHVKLPRIGCVRTHESTRKLARRLDNGTARILSATVSYRAGRWWCSFQVEVQRTDPVPARPTDTVGVDLGIHHLAALSLPIPGVTDGRGMVANPRQLETALRRLRRVSRRCSRRRGPDRRTGVEPSKRWQRANATRARLHARVANLRRDGIHKLTTALAARFGIIVIEDLNVSGMLHNRRLARQIADAGFAEIRRQLDYKTRWRAGTLLVADRWFPSSKTCSGCGVAKTKLPLSVRTFTCEHCGLVLDRDVNAARNLAQLATLNELDQSAGTSTASCAGTLNKPAGNPGKTSRAGTGTVTGRPTPQGAGQRQRSNPQTQDTLNASSLNG